MIRPSSGRDDGYDQHLPGTHDQKIHYNEPKGITEIDNDIKFVTACAVSGHSHTPQPFVGDTHVSVPTV